jgi:hypothetical protein
MPHDRWVRLSTVPGWWIEIKDDLNDTKYDYKCVSSAKRQRPVSEGTKRSTSSSRSLTDGFAVVVHWPLRSPDFIPPILPCTELLQKHGVWTQSKEQTETTSSNFRCCKILTCYIMFRSSWISDIRCFIYQLRNRLESELCPYDTSNWEQRQEYDLGTNM